MEEKKTLSSVVGDISLAIQRIMENDGELTKEIEDELLSNEVNLSEKVDAYYYVLDKITAEEIYWKQKADEFRKLSVSCKKLKANLNDRIKYAMEKLDRVDVYGDDFRFKLSTSPGRLIVEDIELVPTEYKTVVHITEVDNGTLKKAIVRGEEIPGARIEYNKIVRKFVNRKKIKEKSQ